MTAGGLDPDLIRLNVDAARQRKENALADYEAASAELAWWLQGAELAGVAVVRDDGEPDAANIEELFPPAALFDTGGAEPTLRQAIVAHLREHPMIPFPIASIAHALVLRGWMPDRADTQKRVSDMASLMAGEDQLQRIERGGCVQTTSAPHGRLRTATCYRLPPCCRDGDARSASHRVGLARRTEMTLRRGGPNPAIQPNVRSPRARDCAPLARGARYCSC
jgi:hypothetical protein